jgi:ring-1,2-phenylacetyl-CoA epoxidase subunit PaaC
LNNSKLDYVLHLADNGLILAQRLGEWCGHGPVLEQDIALTNIALDVLGQSRYFYQYAAEIDGQGKSEDHYAYFRGERDFKNFLLLEQPNGDWAHTIMRQFFYDNFMHLVYTGLLSSKDEQIAAIASKAIKEVEYHLKFSSEWVIRMGDGTAESHERVQNAANFMWEFTGELFVPTSYDQEMALQGIAPNIGSLKNEWQSRVNEVFDEATIQVPQATWFQSGGKTGLHSENLGFLLTDLQYLQRTFPGNNW